MPKLAVPFEIRRLFSKADPPHPRQASIRRWLTLGMTLVVAVTVFIGGLPAIGICWRQLERQVHLCVLNAQSSTKALYSAEKKNFLQLTQLMSECPTLCGLLQRQDIPEITSYLDTLRVNTSADLLAVVTNKGQTIFSGSVDLPSEAVLASQQPPFADFIVLEDPSRLAIFAVSEIASPETCEEGFSGQVIAIRVLGNDVMQSLAKDTGLEQSLIIGDQRVATSFDNALDRVSSQEASVTQETCCTTSTIGNDIYYVGLTPLLDHQGRVIALSEVALPANIIRNNALHTLALFIGVGALAALAGTGLAILLTQRITRPLRALAEAAERMGAGNLDTPIPVSSGWIAIDRLANQLERSRKNLQKNQQITRRELRRVVQLLGATREGVVTMNTEGIVTWANMDACQILGYDLLTLLRKHYSQVFRPAPRETNSLGDIIQPSLGKPVPDHLTVLNAKNSIITLSISHSVLDTEEDDKNIQYEHIVTLRDVSEEQAVNRLRSEFLANVAHEFRTPLSAISASTELLIDEGESMKPEEISHLAHTIQVSTVHLQTLVNNLLESAIIEAGVFRLRYHSVVLKDFLQNLVEIMSPLLQRRQQKLDVDVSQDLQVFWGDSDRLIQALVNLVENAGKFSSSGEIIHLTIQKEGDAITFTVLDRGQGLPTERFGDLFDRFITGGRPHGAQYGIGLGLPIVKAIVKAHGGRVGAENRPDGGVKVWFTIPLIQKSDKGENT